MTWFTGIKREFRRATRRFAGKPILYVEIGCWAGESMEWTLQNILTHPDARAIGLDPYPTDTKRDAAGIEEIIKQMLARLQPYRAKCKWHRVRSATAMRHWGSYGPSPLVADNSIDLLYIDGAHDAASVVIDFALAWEFLKVGSVVIFDDFGIGKRKTIRHVPEAVEAIRMAWGDQIKTISQGRQVAIEVTSKAAPIEPARER